MNEKISIVVPVYNASKFIGDCIKSILDQTYSNFELILIDDGSTDDSYKICESFNDNRIKLFSQINHGVSFTRNKGISFSSGKYITFVDSDDKIDKKMLEKMMFYKNKYNADLVECNLKYFKDTNEYVLYENNSVLSNINIEEIEKSIISINYLNKQSKGIYGPVRCIGGKLYDLETIKKYKIKFNDNIYILEDGIFNLEYCKYIKNIVIIPDPVYEYRQVSTSTTYRYNKDQIKQYELINNYFKKEKFNTKYKLPFNLHLFELLSTYIFREYKYYNLSFKKFKDLVKLEINKVDNKNMIKYLKYKDLNLKGKVKLFCFKNRFYYLLFIFTKLRNIGE